MYVYRCLLVLIDIQVQYVYVYIHKVNKQHIYILSFISIYSEILRQRITCKFFNTCVIFLCTVYVNINNRYIHLDIYSLNIYIYVCMCRYAYNICIKYSTVNM